MSTESKIPETGYRSKLMRCTSCGIDIDTRQRIKTYDGEGNDTGVSIAIRKCIPCAKEAEKRYAANRVREAQIRAKHEKTLADLIASIPKPKYEQSEFDMGLD